VYYSRREQILAQTKEVKQQILAARKNSYPGECRSLTGNPLVLASAFKIVGRLNVKLIATEVFQSEQGQGYLAFVALSRVCCRGHPLEVTQSMRFGLGAGLHPVLE
jgi:hypothetical protein